MATFVSDDRQRRLQVDDEAKGDEGDDNGSAARLMVLMSLQRGWWCRQGHAVGKLGGGWRRDEDDGSIDLSKTEVRTGDSSTISENEDLAMDKISSRVVCSRGGRRRWWKGGKSGRHWEEGGRWSRSTAKISMWWGFAEEEDAAEQWRRWGRRWTVAVVFYFFFLFLFPFLFFLSFFLTDGEERRGEI